MNMKELVELRLLLRKFRGEFVSEEERCGEEMFVGVKLVEWEEMWKKVVDGVEYRIDIEEVEGGV